MVAKKSQSRSATSPVVIGPVIENAVCKWAGPVICVRDMQVIYNLISAHRAQNKKEQKDKGMVFKVLPGRRFLLEKKPRGVQSRSRFTLRKNHKRPVNSSASEFDEDAVTGIAFTVISLTPGADFDINYRANIFGSGAITTHGRKNIEELDSVRGELETLLGWLLGGWRDKYISAFPEQFSRREIAALATRPGPPSITITPVQVSNIVRSVRFQDFKFSSLPRLFDALSCHLSAASSDTVNYKPNTFPTLTWRTSYQDAKITVNMFESGRCMMLSKLDDGPFLQWFDSSFLPIVQSQLVCSLFTASFDAHYSGVAPTLESIKLVAGGNSNHQQQQQHRRRQESAPISYTPTGLLLVA